MTRPPCSPHASSTADYDPRMVDLYDEDNPDGPDHDYYRSLARDADAWTILDLGCGTGLLTVSLAAPGRRVVGVDPSAAMLAYARRRPGATGVAWVEGDSRSITGGPFDLMIMSGNAAQHIPDPDWQRTLRDLRRHCRPGAVLAFETRNPAARAWEEWNAAGHRRRRTVHGSLVEWLEAEGIGQGRVRLRSHTRVEGSGEHLVSEQLLTFRGQDAVREQLVCAGFEPTAVWGGWRRTPFTGTEPLMIIEARA